MKLDFRTPGEGGAMQAGYNAQLLCLTNEIFATVPPDKLILAAGKKPGEAACLRLRRALCSSASKNSSGMANPP